MVGEVAVVLLELAERIVRVHAQFLRAAAREVLHRQRDLGGGIDRGAVLERAALQAFDQRLHDVGSKVGVFGENLVCTVPARLGQQVGHVAVHGAQADGVVFRPHDLGEGLDHRHVASGRLAFFQELLAQCGGGQTGFFRELAEGATAGTDALARIGFDMVAGVVLKDQRDAQAGAFGHFLELVGVSCQLLRRNPEAAATGHHAAVAHIGRTPCGRAQDEPGHFLVVDVVRRGRRDGTAAARVVVVDHHHADLFGVGHLRDEVVDTLLHGPTPVFVDIQFPVAVGILELLAVQRQQRLGPRPHDGLGHLVTTTATATGQHRQAGQPHQAHLGRKRHGTQAQVHLLCGFFHRCLL